MRSSEGVYVERLDHLRALAVFMVFFWHFIHGSADIPLVPFDFAPPTIVFPISLLEQGHSGVSLFMVLSGYLFAKLIGPRDIAYGAFLRNRGLRLLPMLALVLIPGIIGGRETISSLLTGLLHGGWAADGTWSVMVEMQFYVALPLLLAIIRGRPLTALLAIMAAAIGLRAMLWACGGDIKDLATYSLIGRIDNFAAGMLLASIEARSGPSARHHAMAAIALGVFALLYHGFNLLGGMEIPSRSPIWIGLPTLESIGFAALIHLYCGMRPGLPPAISGALAKVGEASYSIYLLHFMVIMGCLTLMEPWGAADWGFAGLAALSAPVFILCVAIGRLTYALIEAPFLRWRVPYARRGAALAGPATDVAGRSAGSRLTGA